MAFEHGQRDAEQDVESIEEQDVPHAEKRLDDKNDKNKNKKTTGEGRGGVQ